MLESQHRLHVSSCSEDSSQNGPSPRSTGFDGSGVKYTIFTGPTKLNPKARSKSLTVPNFLFIWFAPTLCGNLSGTADDPGVPDPIVQFLTRACVASLPGLSALSPGTLLSFAKYFICLITTILDTATWSRHAQDASGRGELTILRCLSLTKHLGEGAKQEKWMEATALVFPPLRKLDNGFMGVMVVH